MHTCLTYARLVSLQPCAYVHTHSIVCTHSTHTYVSLYLHTYIHIWTCIHARINTFQYLICFLPTQTHTYIHTYMCHTPYVRHANFLASAAKHRFFQGFFQVRNFRFVVYFTPVYICAHLHFSACIHVCVRAVCMCAYIHTYDTVNCFPQDFFQMGISKV